MYPIICTAEHLLGRLASDHEVHGSEQLVTAASNQAVGSKCQTVGRLFRAGRSQTNGLQETGQVVGNGATPCGHADNGEEVTNGLDVAELARQRPVPRKRVGAVSHILGAHELESSSLHGGDTLRDLAHVGDTVTLLDAETDLTMAEVVVVVLIGHEPLVDTKDTTGLEDAVDLAVDTLKGRGVDGSLDGVDSVESVLLEGHLLHFQLAICPAVWGLVRKRCETYHEVALDESQLVGQTLLLSVVSGSVNLVVVVVQTSDVGASKLGDFTSRATNTAANIEDLHSLLDAHAVGKVVLVAGNGLVERLAVGEAAEVEGLAPTIFVQIGSEVVVATCLLAHGQLSGRAGISYCLVNVAYSAVRACPAVISDLRQLSRSQCEFNIQHAPQQSRSRQACCPSA